MSRVNSAGDNVSLMGRNRGHVEENVRIGRTSAAAVLSLFLLAGASEAGEITVISTVAVKGAYLELVPAFERATENKVVTMWVGAGSIIERLKRGETVDLVIVTASGIDELNKLGRLAPGVPMANLGSAQRCARARQSPTYHPAKPSSAPCWHRSQSPCRLGRAVSISQVCSRNGALPTNSSRRSSRQPG